MQAGVILDALLMHKAYQKFRRDKGHEELPADAIKSVIAGKYFPIDMRNLARNQGLHVYVYTASSEWQFDGEPVRIDI
jgi:hypothetical protein